MKKSPSSISLMTRNGRYTILYGIHMRTQNPDDLPADTTAVILETGMHRYLDDPLASLKKLSHHVQYRALIPVIEKKQIPIIFADLKYRYPDPLLLMADTAFSGMEWMAGIRLLKSKRATPFRFVIGAWLLLPFITNMLRLLSALLGIGQRQTGELKKLSHRMHPEADILYLTIRNAVIAEKAAYIAHLSGEKSHVVIVLGAGHVGIEDMLEADQGRRLAVLRKYHPFLKKLVNKHYLYRAVVFDTDKKGGISVNVHNVSSLKALL